MLDSRGFDLWADGYDEAVMISEEENGFPFAGYKAVLERIFRTVASKPRAAVLDLGFGTGTLTARLYESGCDVYGQDFSAKMCALAQAKMPRAHLYQGDVAQGLAPPLRERRYDFIVATYSLHHLTDEQKIGCLRALRKRLKAGGTILIGDVAFESRAVLERFRLQAGSDWDDEEYYFAADELRRAFPDMSFVQVSGCAGVISIPR